MRKKTYEELREKNNVLREDNERLTDESNTEIQEKHDLRMAEAALKERNQEIVDQHYKIVALEGVAELNEVERQRLLEELKGHPTAEEYMNLELEYRQTEMRLGSALTDLEETRRDNQALTEELKELQRVHSATDSYLSECLEREEQMRGRIESLSSEVVLYRSSGLISRKEYGEMCEMYQRKIELLDQQITELREQIQDKDRRLYLYRCTKEGQDLNLDQWIHISQFRNRCSELEEDLLRERQHKIESAELQRRINTLTNRNAELVDEWDEAKDEVKELAEQLVELSEKYGSMTDSFVLMAEERDHYYIAHSVAEDAYENLRKAIRAQQTSFTVQRYAVRSYDGKDYIVPL